MFSLLGFGGLGLQGFRVYRFIMGFIRFRV